MTVRLVWPIGFSSYRAGQGNDNEKESVSRPGGGRAVPGVAGVVLWW